MKCRNKHYACHRDPAERHGPYLECIYKVHNQIVNLKPYPEAAPLYRAAIQQHRKLRSLLGVWNAYRESPWRIGPDSCNSSAAAERKPGYSHIRPSSPYPPNRIDLIASFYK